ncbi:hypothetical protein WJX84_000543 [Apatococcus fuscideae]|uniref:Uncharacterized protein n=1 Tax=Apatococcus fuscideae TaxID=2026836 RepID=A0AAW1SMF7_9CHLO
MEAHLLTQPSIENEFALMMHERIVSLEQLVDGLRRDLDTRVPQPPPTAFSIDGRIRGWYFSVKVWADVWPQDEAGEDQAIHAVLQEAGRLGGKGDLSLVLCKHDTRQAQCNHMQLALAFNRVAHPDTATAAEVNEEESIFEMFGRRVLCIEGIIDTHEPSFNPAAFGAAIDRVWHPMLLNRGFNNMEALSAKGQQCEDASCAVYGGRSMREVALPQLWQELVHAVNGRALQYRLHDGFAESEIGPEPFELGNPMKLVANLALSTQLGDSDVNMEHPGALTILHMVYPEAE